MQYEGSSVFEQNQKQTTVKEASKRTAVDNISNGPVVDVPNTASAWPQVHHPNDGTVGAIKDDQNHEGHSSTSDQIRRRSQVPPSDDGGSRHANPASGESENVSLRGEQDVRGISVTQAVLEAAQELARMSQIPGVAEVAGFVIILVNMVTDSSDLTGIADGMIKRCRTVMILLQRAASLLNEVGRSTSGAVGIVVC